jgi:hypothetical protein
MAIMMCCLARLLLYCTGEGRSVYCTVNEKNLSLFLLDLRRFKNLKSCEDTCEWDFITHFIRRSRYKHLQCMLRTYQNRSPFSLPSIYLFPCTGTSWIWKKSKISENSHPPARARFNLNELNRWVIDSAQIFELNRESSPMSWIDLSWINSAHELNQFSSWDSMTGPVKIFF